LSLAGFAVGGKRRKVAEMVGESEPVKLSVKNQLTRSLPELRKGVQELPEVSQYQDYATLHARLIWLEISVRSLRDKLYNLQFQEEICLDPSSENEG
jgi:hypothetical protein